MEGMNTSTALIVRGQLLRDLRYRFCECAIAMLSSQPPSLALLSPPVARDGEDYLLVRWSSAEKRKHHDQ